jgi:hypothetical protein
VEQILDSKVRTQRGRVKAGQARRTRVEYLVSYNGRDTLILHGRDRRA